MQLCVYTRPAWKPSGKQNRALVITSSASHESQGKDPGSTLIQKCNHHFTDLEESFTTQIMGLFSLPLPSTKQICYGQTDRFLVTYSPIVGNIFFFEDKLKKKKKTPYFFNHRECGQELLGEHITAWQGRFIVAASEMVCAIG